MHQKTLNNLHRDWSANNTYDGPIEKCEGFIVRETGWLSRKHKLLKFQTLNFLCMQQILHILIMFRTEKQTQKIFY